jgi:precorrin-6A/cobalt-precorrin-6A reductase
LIRILILGGTTEASVLARRLAGDPRFAATLSLAGRTTSPASQPLPTRISGFGGEDGLARWLEAEAIAAVIDATHPYATQISANAVAACARLSLPLASIARPPWTPQPGDRWTEAPSAEAAASLLATDPEPRRVFLSLGRLELASFASAPHHDYLARLIEPPTNMILPPRIRFIFERGPFDKTSEAHLIAAERIEAMVSKNSGGLATYAKIEAAREAGLPVIMIARPRKPRGEVVQSPEDAVAWLADHIATSSRRGV